MFSRVVRPTLLMLLIPVVYASSVDRQRTFHERTIFKPTVHESRFANVPHSSARSRCAETQLPEALTTPDPILSVISTADRVTVSFIVGTDGQVHSPLILQGGDPREYRAVLNTIRSWRYRPATCNGVPTEAEAKVQFSRR